MHTYQHPGTVVNLNEELVQAPKFLANVFATVL